LASGVLAKSSITLGVVSDTHMPRHARALPAALKRGLAQVDVIVHCGDIVDAMAIALFEAIAPVEAVAGNNDPPELHRRFGKRRMLEFGSVRIGVVHGHEGSGRSTPARAQNAFTDERVDAILFGHSHVPYCEVHGGVLLFNPGSPTDRRRQREFSYGILRIANGVIEPQLFFYADKSP
jgi:putative phosphoesterase